MSEENKPIESVEALQLAMSEDPEFILGFRDRLIQMDLDDHEVNALIQRLDEIIEILLSTPNPQSLDPNLLNEIVHIINAIQDIESIVKQNELISQMFGDDGEDTEENDIIPYPSEEVLEFLDSLDLESNDSRTDSPAEIITLHDNDDPSCEP